MKNFIKYWVLLALLLSFNLTAQNGFIAYPINPVAFTSVKVTDSFWSQRLKANREVTIPIMHVVCLLVRRYAWGEVRRPKSWRL